MRGVSILQIFGGATIAAILVVPFASSPATAAVLTGSATIVDGDTLEISGVRVRLFGVDAPETDQACLDDAGRLYFCGISAREFIKSLVRGAPI